MWLDGTYTCTETETETVGGSRGSEAEVMRQQEQ